MFKSLFDNVPEPIFGKEDSNDLPVATEEEPLVDDSDQFEDIGQSTFSWGTPVYDSTLRTISIELTLPQSTNNRALIRSSAIRVEVRSGSSWVTASSWRRYAGGAGTTRMITVAPNSSVGAGTYRVVLVANSIAFGLRRNQPTSDIPSCEVSVGTYSAIAANTIAWGRPPTASTQFISAPLILAIGRFRFTSLSFEVINSSGNVDSNWRVTVDHSTNAFDINVPTSIYAISIFAEATQTNFPYGTSGTFRIRVKARSIGIGGSQAGSRPLSAIASPGIPFNNLAVLPTLTWSHETGSTSRTNAFISARLNTSGDSIESVGASDFQVRDVAGSSVSGFQFFSSSFRNPSGSTTSTAQDGQYITVRVDAPANINNVVTLVLRQQSIESGRGYDIPRLADLVSDPILINNTGLPSTAGAKWTSITGGLKLQGQVQFIGNSVSGISGSDFEVIALQGGIVQRNGWTITVSHTSRAANGVLTVTAVPSTGGFVIESGLYFLRLKANSLIAGGSTTNNAPPTRVSSRAATVNPLTVRWGTPAFCDGSNRVTTTLTFNQNITGLIASDIEVRNSANTGSISGWSHTITGSGSSYTVVSAPPRPTMASFRLRLKINSVLVGTETVPGDNVDSALFTVDNRKQGPEDEMPAITIDGGSFCTTNRRITWQAYITGATVTQAGLLTSADTTVNRSDDSISITETVTRSSATSSSYRIQTNAIPAEKMGSMSVTIQANALGANSNPLAVTSGCVYYDTRVTPETPTVIISAGNFDSDTNTIYFYAYWENTTAAALDHSTNGFTAADISVTGATGARVNLGTRMGLSYPISITNLPSNTASNLKITIRANALGMGTNIATDSSCVGYDTRPVAVTPQIVIGPGNFCPTSRKLTWRVFVTNATTTQFAALTEADITVNASPNTSPVLNGTESIVERGDNSLVVEVTVPTGRNGNASITIAANALGAGTNSRAITSACVNYDTRAATVATASWGTITGGTNPMAALQGRITFATTTDVRDIEPGDFDVIITGGTAHARASWTMQVSHDYTNSGRAYVDVTAIPNGTFNTSFGLRLRANTVRSGGSSSLNAPTANVDSAVVAFDNRTTDTAPPPTISIDGGTYCPTSKSIVWNAYVTNADDDELASFAANDIRINNAIANGSAFTPTVTVTRTPSTGDSFRIQTTVIPDSRSGEMSITINANALGTGTNRSVTSSCVSYDTRTVEEPLVATWRYANYCETSDRVIAALRFNKAITGLDVSPTSNGDLQISNDQKNTNLGWTLSFAGHTGSGTNASLAANTDLRITVEPPTNTNTNIYLLVISNSVASGTQTGPSTTTYSEVIPVNNIPDTPVRPPSITIDGGTYCPTSRKIVWNAYIVNASTDQLSAFTNADVDINHTQSSGITFTPTDTVTRTQSTGDSFRIETDAIPTETVGEMSITIIANALGTDTNRSVTSGCVSYDTRAAADPLVGVWNYANFCETGNRVLASITFNKAITGLNVFTSSANNGAIYIENERKQSPKNGWVFSFSGHTGTGNNASLAANTPLVIEITPPVNTNENIYLAFNANQVTYDSTQTGPSADIYTEVIAVDNRTEEDIVETPDVTISAGSFDIGTRQAYFHIYWENVTEAQLDHTINGFEAADITVSGAEGATITLGTRMGFSYPCHVTIPAGISGNVKITVLENAVGPDTNLAEDSPCIAYDTTTEATIENTPYLVVTDLPETEQTGVSFMFNFAGYLEDQQINIAGLTADDFIITAPDTGATITLS